MEILEKDYTQEPYTGWSEELVEVRRDENVHSVLFSSYLIGRHEYIEVLLDDVWDFVDHERGYVKAERVVWKDGGSSYAGSKWFNHNHPTLWNRMAYIGAGAYPDHIVLSRKGTIKRDIWGNEIK